MFTKKLLIILSIVSFVLSLLMPLDKEIPLEITTGVIVLSAIGNTC